MRSLPATISCTFKSIPLILIIVHRCGATISVGSNENRYSTSISPPLLTLKSEYSMMLFTNTLSFLIPSLSSLSPASTFKLPYSPCLSRITSGIPFFINSSHSTPIVYDFPLPDFPVTNILPKFFTNKFTSKG